MNMVPSVPAVVRGALRGRFSQACISPLPLLALVLCTPAAAAQTDSLVAQGPEERASYSRGLDEGFGAALQHSVATRFWSGFISGVPLGAGSLHLLLTGDFVPVSAGAAALGTAGGIAVLARAQRDPVLYEFQQESLLLIGGEAYAAGYRAGFEETVRERRIRVARGGIVVGALAGTVGFIAVVLAALSTTPT